METRVLLGRRHEEEIKQKRVCLGSSWRWKGLRQVSVCSVVEAYSRNHMNTAFDVTESPVFLMGSIACRVTEKLNSMWKGVGGGFDYIQYLIWDINAFSNSKIISLLFYFKCEMKKPFPNSGCEECSWQRLDYSRELFHQHSAHYRSRQPLDYVIWTIIFAAILLVSFILIFTIPIWQSYSLYTSLCVYM